MFRFATGKLHRAYDESLAAANDLQRSDSGACPKQQPTAEPHSILSLHTSHPPFHQPTIPAHTAELHKLDPITIPELLRKPPHLPPTLPPTHPSTNPHRRAVQAGPY